MDLKSGNERYKNAYGDEYSYLYTLTCGNMFPIKIKRKNQDILLDKAKLMPYCII